MNTLVVFSRFVLKNIYYIILHIPFYLFSDCITDQLSIYTDNSRATALLPPSSGWKFLYPL